MLGTIWRGEYQCVRSMCWVGHALGESVREAGMGQQSLTFRNPLLCVCIRMGKTAGRFNSVSSPKGFSNFRLPLRESWCRGTGKNLYTNIDPLQSPVLSSSQTWRGWFKSYLHVTWRVCSLSNAKTVTRSIPSDYSDGDLNSATLLLCNPRPGAQGREQVHVSFPIFKMKLLSSFTLHVGSEG